MLVHSGVTWFKDVCIACITQQNFPHMDPVHGWEGKPLAESAQFLNICQEEVYF